MINKFKTALMNAVGNPGVDGTGQQFVNGPGSSSNGQGTSADGSSGVAGTTSNSTNSVLRSKSPGSGGRQRRPSDAVSKKPVRYEYSRPHFLNLLTQDEILVSADHAVRPIIVPREPLPWSTGYAETINSGKSKRNEDQARIHSGLIQIPIGSTVDDKTDLSLEQDVEKHINIPYQYFGIFDGHAGPGAAVAAAAQLHNIVHEKLTEIGHHLADMGPFCEGSMRNKNKGILWFPQTSITNDSLIVGALESSFEIMDDLIERENKIYDGVNGGCTVVVCLFIMGKIYIANAGDSRAVLCRRNFEALPLSDDFTPETERTRVRQLAAENPHLLGTEFTALEFLRRPVRRDIGNKILYRGGNMTGWAYKVATEEDLRFPVVFGYGKRSRVLATIGVTRGFGDHELNAHGSSIRIKPFLKSQPEVRIVDLKELECGEDDVILMATDGLWDVTSNDLAASVVFSTLDQFPTSDPKHGYSNIRYRYISAAQDLVMHARGKFNDRNWRMSDGSAATIDDISVFVIPVYPYKQAVLQEEENRKLLASMSITEADKNLANGNNTIDKTNDNIVHDTSVLNGDEIDLLVRTPKSKTKVKSTPKTENSHDIESNSMVESIPSRDLKGDGKLDPTNEQGSIKQKEEETRSNLVENIQAESNSTVTSIENSDESTTENSIEDPNENPK